MKRKILLFSVFSLLCFTISAQKISVSGIVTSKEDGLPIIGASVVEKGTTNGTITNVDGKYSLTVNNGARIIFSYVGNETQEHRVTTTGTLNIVLSSTAIAINEVVVTAMGIVAEKKKLNFSVQSVDAGDLTSGRESNFVHALQGRIAGVDVSTQGGSPTGSSQILIRGISSINNAQNNEPLFIIDGVPVSGGATKAAEVNPNDIENVTVLKGAAAAALYGQEASNGVIMINTKKAQVGQLRTEASVTLQIDEPFRVPGIQQSYINGNQGVYNPKSGGGWGPELRDGDQIYDNINNYLQTGNLQKYDFSITGGSERFSVFASAEYSNHNGIIPEDFLKRYGLLLKTSFKINNKLKADISANIVNRNSRGAGTGIMSTVYNWPINDDIMNYKNPDGSIRYRYIADIRTNSPLSPLWGRKEDMSLLAQSRNLLSATLNYSPLKNLSFTGRIGYDATNSESNSITKPRWDKILKPDGSGYEDYDLEKTYYGSYYFSDSFSELVSLNGFANYDQKITEDFSLNALVGAEMKTSRARGTSITGYDFIVEGIYSLKNVNSIEMSDIGFSHTQKNTYGYYGSLKFDYRGLAHLEGTLRNDHSSTLSVENRSYWYPSVSAGVIFTELFGIKSDLLNYAKLKGNFAKVGKDAPMYRLTNWFKQWPSFPDGGYGVDPTRGANDKLMPEMMSSFEIGGDFRLFKDRTRIDLAYYSTTVDNQIVEVRVSPASGYILQTRNEGSITNKGVELTIDQKIFKNKIFSWDASLNFGLNRGKVVSLPDQLFEVGPSDGYVGNDIKAVAYLGGSTMSISGTDYLRNDAGQIICDESGFPKIDGTKKIIGNREPDFTTGLLNKFRYGNWNLDFMFNFRMGGDVINGTSRSLLSGGQHRMLEVYRNRQIVIEGVVQQSDGTFSKNITPVVFDQNFVTNYFNTVSTNFIEDGTFLRLSYITLSYNLDKLVKKAGIAGMNVSLTGRNLFLLTSYSGSDPQVNYTGSTGGSGTFGIDNLNVPGVRSFTFNLNMKF